MDWVNSSRNCLLVQSPRQSCVGGFVSGAGGRAVYLANDLSFARARRFRESGALSISLASTTDSFAGIELGSAQAKKRRVTGPAFHPHRHHPRSFHVAAALGI